MVRRMCQGQATKTAPLLQAGRTNCETKSLEGPFFRMIAPMGRAGVETTPMSVLACAGSLVTPLPG